MASSNVVEQARSLLEERRTELSSELAQIERALADLGGAPKRRGPGRPRGSGSSTNGRGGAKKRRRRRGGTRAEQALKHISEAPGMTASQIAEKLGIKPNYVYRVMAELEADGKAKKEGKGYVPAASA